LNPWRTYEFRGRDRNDTPFVDFGCVEVKETGLALSSHMLREASWVNSVSCVIPTFKRYYEAQGVSKLRSMLLWQDGRPVDLPFAEGWEEL